MNIIFFKTALLAAPLFVFHHYAFHYQHIHAGKSHLLTTAGILYFMGAAYAANVNLHLLQITAYWVLGSVPVLLVAVYRHLPARRLFYFLSVLWQVLILFLIKVKFWL